jgi:hypothetical protein
MNVKVLFLFYLFGFLTVPLFAHAQDSMPNPSRVQWTGLYYKAHILFFPVHVRVNLTRIPLSISKKALIVPEEGEAAYPQIDPSCRIDIDSKILGLNSLISLWFDPNGAAFQRTQIDTGSKKRIKTYRLLKNGFYSQDIRPGENEGGLVPNKWTQLNKGAGTFKFLPPKGKVISEPTALFYLVSASNLSQPGDKWEQYIFTKYGIYKVTLHADTFREIEVGYEGSRSGNRTSHAGVCKTLHIRMSARPLDLSGENDFEFLGLKGDIDLFLETSTRILVQISGKTDILGYTEIKLREVTF